MLRVVTYHRIGSVGRDDLLHPRLINASPREFSRQARYFAKNYDPVNMDDVLAAAQRRAPLPKRAILITFDDAYRDFATTSWPILKSHGLPVTLFVPTAYPDHPERSFWWDRLYRCFRTTSRSSIDLGTGDVLRWRDDSERMQCLVQVENQVRSVPWEKAMALLDHVCGQLGDEPAPGAAILGWDELRALARDGVTLCPHSEWHPPLTHVSLERLGQEVRASWETLAREIGHSLPVFSYPNGSHDEAAVAAVREAGYQLAFTQINGTNDLARCDPLRLRRTNVTRRAAQPLLHLRLQPWFMGFDAWRKRKRYRAHTRTCRTTTPGSEAETIAGSRRVAYIMSRFPKISETFILYEILALEELGWEVEVFPLLRERQPVSHPEARDIVARAHFQPFLSPAILAANLRFAFRRPAAYFGALREIVRGTWGSPNFLAGALGIFPKAVRAAELMQQLDVKHVHAHFISHPAVAALIIHRLTGIPYSVTAHGSDLHVERRMLDRKVAAARFVVTISQYNRNLILEECGPGVEDKVRVIHCGVDTDVFAGNGKHNGNGHQAFQILCVASFEEVKGHEYLVQACALLKARGIPFECHLIGDGPRRARVQSQIRELGLTTCVLVHGPQPRATVAKFAARAQVFVLPSVPTRSGKREGIPVVLMEGMASGLPVVASDISGIPELIENRRSGLLVPPRDVEALSSALEELATNAGLRETLGQAGRARVVERFNLRTNAKTLACMFETVVAENRTVL